MKVKCYSVRLQSVMSISDKAVKVEDFNGHSDIIPISQIYGDDFNVIKSEALWISAWLLEQKNITYSRKKYRWFDKETGRMLPTIKVEHHVPSQLPITESKPDDELIRPAAECCK